MDNTPPPASSAQASSRRVLLGNLVSPLGALLVLALAFFVWQWLDTRHEIDTLSQELARRLRDSDTSSQEGRLIARQAQEAGREIQVKLGVLEGKLQESQNQQLALETLYQELARGRDEWVLAEIEQILVIASQQLQLASNVSAALVALQTADARLARSDRQQFTPLRKVLNRDIEKLKVVPNLDLAGASLKIEQIIGAIDTLPLAYEGRLQAERVTVPAAQQGFWRNLGMQIWGELRQLVQVQNMDRPDPVLLAPSQAYFLRENVKLRLLNARLSLLQRDQNGYREDIRAASNWIGRYFDVRVKLVAAVQSSLRQLAAASVNVEAPTITDSLNAVRNLKVSREVSRDRAAAK